MRLGAPADSRTPREKLLETIAGLGRTREQLEEEIRSIPERDHASRVEFLLKNPGKRSFDAGAASQAFKFEAALAKAHERLRRVDAELRAAADALSAMTVAAESDARAEEARLEAVRVAIEEAAIASAKEAAHTGPQAAPAGAVVPVLRDDPAWKRLSRAFSPGSS
jgi:hypothetical protein